jgi:hypothetical protein
MDVTQDTVHHRPLLRPVYVLVSRAYSRSYRTS